MPKKFIFRLSNSLIYNGYILDIIASPNGLNTTNTICDYNEHFYCNVSLQIGNFLASNITIVPIEIPVNSTKDIHVGSYDLMSIIDKLPSNMFTIYHNGNDSKLTLGGKDTENCENDYLWVDYLCTVNNTENQLAIILRVHNKNQ